MQITTKLDELLEYINSKTQEQTEEIEERLIDKIDSYLSHCVEDFFSQHSEEIKQIIKDRIEEEFEDDDEDLVILEPTIN